MKIMAFSIYPATHLSYRFSPGSFWGRNRPCWHRSSWSWQYKEVFVVKHCFSQKSPLTKQWTLLMTWEITFLSPSSLLAYLLYLSATRCFAYKQFKASMTSFLVDCKDTSIVRLRYTKENVNAIKETKNTAVQSQNVKDKYKSLDAPYSFPACAAPDCTYLSEMAAVCGNKSSTGSTSECFFYIDPV